MPAFVKSRFGASGIRGDDGTTVCFFSRKKSRNDWRIWAEVMSCQTRISTDSRNLKISGEGCQIQSLARGGVSNLGRLPGGAKLLINLLGLVISLLGLKGVTQTRERPRVARSPLQVFAKNFLCIVRAIHCQEQTPKGWSNGWIPGRRFAVTERVLTGNGLF